MKERITGAQIIGFLEAVEAGVPGQVLPRRIPTSPLRAQRVHQGGTGVKPGGKQRHLIDLIRSVAACKAVYAGPIPTPASKYSSSWSNSINRATCKA